MVNKSKHEKKKLLAQVKMSLKFTSNPNSPTAWAQRRYLEDHGTKVYTDYR